MPMMMIIVITSGGSNCVVDCDDVVFLPVNVMAEEIPESRD